VDAEVFNTAIAVAKATVSVHAEGCMLTVRREKLNDYTDCIYHKVIGRRYLGPSCRASTCMDRPDGCGGW
jgi:hypothetical protein